MAYKSMLYNQLFGLAYILNSDSGGRQFDKARAHLCVFTGKENAFFWRNYLIESYIASK
jgi:hypothetical protein